MWRSLVAAVSLLGIHINVCRAEVEQRLNLKKLPFENASRNEKEDVGQRFSGYFRLNRTYSAEMFFFMFERRAEAASAPVVVWMTGGPGCSSELAVRVALEPPGSPFPAPPLLRYPPFYDSIFVIPPQVFYENGPWSLRRDDQGDIIQDETKYGWDEAATMIFVDQPVNTGFSFSDNEEDRCYDEEYVSRPAGDCTLPPALPHSLTHSLFPRCVARDMEDFVIALMTERPELQNRPFFVTGESYAGHYVPAVAYQIFKSKMLKDKVDFKGLAIGNGLTVPSSQYGAYPICAREHDLISEETKDRMVAIAPVCQYALEACDEYDVAFECTLAVMFCQATMFSPIMLESPGLNVYDYRKQCEGEMCYDFSLAEEYLNRPDVQKALGVSKAWEQCDMSVHEDMMSDWGHRFDTAIPELLEAGKRVMIYAGDRDVICNEIGNRWWVDQMEWSGSKSWAVAKDQPWEVDEEQAGTVRTFGGLSFVSVADAGHMVPMDKPKQGLHMIKAFLDGRELAASETEAAKEMPTRNEFFVHPRVNFRQMTE